MIVSFVGDCLVLGNDDGRYQMIVSWLRNCLVLWGTTRVYSNVQVHMHDGDRCSFIV